MLSLTELPPRLRLSYMPPPPGHRVYTHVNSNVKISSKAQMRPGIAPSCKCQHYTSER